MYLLATLRSRGVHTIPLLQLLLKMLLRGARPHLILSLSLFISVKALLLSSAATAAATWLTLESRLMHNYAPRVLSAEREKLLPAIINNKRCG